MGAEYTPGTAAVADDLTVELGVEFDNDALTPAQEAQNKANFAQATDLRLDAAPPDLTFDTVDVGGLDLGGVDVGDLSLNLDATSAFDGFGFG